MIEKIKELYDKGLDCHDIGLQVNLTTSEVDKILREQIRIGKLDKAEILNRYKNNQSIRSIANQLNLMYDQVFNVVNEYRKNNYEYLQGKISGKEGQKKFQLDKDFVKYLQPKEILDVYAGTSNTYPKDITITNDINPKCNTKYHMDALEFCKQFSYDSTFDLVDLDPFGECNKVWKEGIRLANKGIIISYGELKTYRYHKGDSEYWKPILGKYNLDYINNIHSLKYALIKRTIELGVENGKNLIPWYIWLPTWTWMRVYYEIK